jgi:hypothetical protein
MHEWLLLLTKLRCVQVLCRPSKAVSWLSVDNKERPSPGDSAAEPDSEDEDIDEAIELAVAAAQRAGADEDKAAEKEEQGVQGDEEKGDEEKGDEEQQCDPEIATKQLIRLKGLALELSNRAPEIVDEELTDETRTTSDAMNKEAIETRDATMSAEEGVAGEGATVEGAEVGSGEAEKEEPELDHTGTEEDGVQKRQLRAADSTQVSLSAS